MVFRLSFKTPDVTDQLDDEDRDNPEAQEVIKKFVEFGECVTIEFDTFNNTARVVEA